MAKVLGNFHLIIDKKNREGKFLCEEIVKSSEFQEGKDWEYEILPENGYKILSDQLKKRILNRDNPTNDKVYIDVFDLDMRVLIDRENYSEELWESIFPADKNRKGGNNKDSDNNKNLSSPSANSSNKENKMVWWIGGGVVFILFASFLVFLFRKRKKIRK